MRGGFICGGESLAGRATAGMVSDRTSRWSVTRCRVRHLFDRGDGVSAALRCADWLCGPFSTPRCPRAVPAALTASASQVFFGRRRPVPSALKVSGQMLREIPVETAWDRPAGLLDRHTSASARFFNRLDQADTPGRINKP